MFHTPSSMGTLPLLWVHCCLYFTVSWFLWLLLRSYSQPFLPGTCIDFLELLLSLSLLFCTMVLCLDISYLGFAWLSKSPKMSSLSRKLKPSSLQHCLNLFPLSLLLFYNWLYGQMFSCPPCLLICLCLFLQSEYFFVCHLRLLSLPSVVIIPIKNIHWVSTLMIIFFICNI